MRTFLAVSLLAVFLPRPSGASAPPKPVKVELGREFRLQKGETAALPDGKSTIRVTGFVNSPCPKGAQCVWSGLDGLCKEVASPALHCLYLRSKRAGDLAACDGIVTFRARARCFREPSVEGGGGPSSCAELEDGLAQRCTELATGPAQ